jgi:hypothetical protein
VRPTAAGLMPQGFAFLLRHVANTAQGRAGKRRLLGRPVPLRSRAANRSHEAKSPLGH